MLAWRPAGSVLVCGNPAGGWGVLTPLAAHHGDVGEADAERRDHLGRLLQQQRAHGAGMVRLEGEDAGTAAQVVLVGQAGDRALRAELGPGSGCRLKGQHMLA